MTSLRHSLLPALVLAVSCTGDHTANRAGSAEDRARLFDELVRLTLAREAFSPVKDQRLGLDFGRQAAALRDQFIAAGTEPELFHALVRLSNLRRDGHLEVRPVPGGLRLEPRPLQQAPVRFEVDFGDPARPLLFVTALDRQVRQRALAILPPDAQPAFGDELVAVNDLPVNDVRKRMEPYLAGSTSNRLWCEFATNVTVRRPDWGRELDEETARYTLRQTDGQTYTIALPWLAPARIAWDEWRPRKFGNLRPLFQTTSFTLLIPARSDLNVVVLDWHTFKEAPFGDIDRLLDFAQRHGLLDHDVICDLTTSRGGRGAWYLLQRLVSRPFKVTFCNLRLSDATPAFIREQVRSEPDDRPLREAMGRLREWLTGEVAAAHARGDGWTRAVPFKLQALPADSDGMLAPAERRFTGRLVVFLGPYGHSQIDQFAAMLIDNGLGHSLGLPTAGQSNSWEWRETVRFPGSRRPVAEFQWSIGHTIRPNGELLEGNPPPPAEVVPVTRDNYPGYYDLLFERALEWLAARSNG